MQPENIALTEAHWRTLQALADRIIPQDPDWPSGWQAGVGDYLAHQFERDLRHQVEPYRRGLEALDDEARARTGKPFAELGNAAQDGILVAVERGDVFTNWPDAPAFFAMAIQHVNEGFYSDPNNGGNKASVAWHMIGYIVKG